MLTSCLFISLALSACGGHGELGGSPVSQADDAETVIPSYLITASSDVADAISDTPVPLFENIDTTALTLIPQSAAGLTEDGMQTTDIISRMNHGLLLKQPVAWFIPSAMPSSMWRHLAMPPSIRPSAGDDTRSPTGGSTSAGGPSSTAVAPPTDNGTALSGAGTAPTASGSTGAAPREGSRLVMPSSEGFSVASTEYKRLYGPGIFNQNALANTIVGTYHNRERIVSNRFLATASGYVTTARLYWQTGLGYAAGHGGTIQLKLLPDDGSQDHLPDLNAKPLATAVYHPRLTPGEKRSLFPEIRFHESHQAIQAGKIYHLVIENIDAKANENFISSNNAITHNGNGRPSRWLNTRDWSTLSGTRPRGTTSQYKWVNLTDKGSSGNYFSPILQLNMSNGQSLGNSDMEGGSVDPKLVFTSNSHTPVRERFTPSSVKQITGFSIATAASVGGSLKWRIMHNRTELASGTIRQPRPNYTPLKLNSGPMLAKMHWYDIEIPNGKTLTLRPGQSYDLEFTPEGSSTWKFAGHRNGAAYGFTWPAAFTESQAQHWYNGNWINTYHWDYKSSRTGANWPVVLHLAP